MVISFLRRRAWNCVTRRLNNVAIEKCVFFHSEATKNTNQVDRKPDSEEKLITKQKFNVGFGSNALSGKTDYQSITWFLSGLDRKAQSRSKQLIKKLEVATAYKGRENALVNYAAQNGILVHTWPDIDLSTEFDLGLVVSFGHMIPAQIINAFPLGIINVHASLLPKWRGAAPIIHALMNGDSQTGITIMKIMPGKFDVGEILAQKAVYINPDETMPELYIKLAKIGAEMLIETVERLPDVLNDGCKQSDSDATYARKVTAKVATIRWNEMRAQNVYDLQRALTGLYYPTTKFEDKTVKLLGIRIHKEPTNLSSSDEHKPGSVIYDKQKNVLLVQCKDKTWISIDQIVMPGRRPMSAKDFKNGFMTKNKKSSIVFQ